MNSPLVSVSGCVLALELSGCGFAARENRPIAHFDAAAAEQPARVADTTAGPKMAANDVKTCAEVPALPAFWNCPSRREWTWRAQPHFKRRT